MGVATVFENTSPPKVNEITKFPGEPETEGDEKVKKLLKAFVDRKVPVMVASNPPVEIVPLLKKLLKTD